MDAASPETTRDILSVIRQNPTISLRDLAAATGHSRETARRAVSRLIAEHHIAIVRAGTGNGYPTTYRIA